MPEPKYHSYLIRFWQEDSQEEPAWRFVLVNLITGQRWGFANLEGLTVFLQDQVDAIPSRDLFQSDKNVDSEAALSEQ